MNKYLVAGGAGFIGSNLCEALIKRGDAVVCVDNLMRGRKELIEGLLKPQGCFRFYQGDASDSTFLKDVLSKESSLCDNQPVNAIIQLAANSDIRSNFPDLEYGATMLTTFQLLKAAKEFGIKNFFLASTSAVYGENSESDEKNARPYCDAHTEFGPISYYGAAKMASEAWVDAFSYMEDMKSSILRFPNVVGPHMTHGVIEDFIDHLREDPTQLRMLGDGSQEKSYIYVSDLISAILAVMGRQGKGVERDVVCVPEGNVRVSRIADEAIEGLGLWRPYIRVSGVTLGAIDANVGWKGDVSRFEYDCSEFRQRFPEWAPEFTGIGAVRQAIRDYVSETGGRLE